MSARRFARLYHDIPEDRQFAAVYDDDQRLAAWVRLRPSADAAWPNPAAIPRRISAEALAHLAEVGLVIVLSNDRFRMPALDDERQERRAWAAVGGLARVDGATRLQGRFAPAIAGTAPAIAEGPPASHQRRNATQLNTTQHVPDKSRTSPDGVPRRNGDDRTTCPTCGDLLSDKDLNVVVMDHGRKLAHRVCPGIAATEPPLGPEHVS